MSLEIIHRKLPKDMSIVKEYHGELEGEPNYVLCGEGKKGKPYFLFRILTENDPLDEYPFAIQLKDGRLMFLMSRAKDIKTSDDIVNGYYTGIRLFNEWFEKEEARKNDSNHNCSSQPERRRWENNNRAISGIRISWYGQKGTLY